MEAKKHTIVMLPTDRSSMLYIGYNQLRHTDEEHKISSGGDYEPQHLFILSDEEIKEGDWYCFPLYKSGYAIKQYNSEKHFNEEPSIILANLKAKKIIATTDKSLSITKIKCNNCKQNLQNAQRKIIGYNAQCNCSVSYIPQIPESFLPIFIKAYNEGKPITGVKLELECGENRQCNCINNSHCLSPVIRTTSNNEVIISIVEEKLYNLSEIEEIHVAIMKQGCLYEEAGWSDEHERLVRLEFHKWLKQNI